MHKKFFGMLLMLALGTLAVGAAQLSASETGEYAQIAKVEPTRLKLLPPDIAAHAEEILSARGITILPDGFGAVYAGMARNESPGSMIGLSFTPDYGVFDPFDLDPDHPFFANEHEGDSVYVVALIDVDVSQLSDFDAMSMTLHVMSDGSVHVTGAWLLYSNSQIFGEGEEDAFLRAFEEIHGVSFSEWMEQNEPSASAAPSFYPGDVMAEISPLAPRASGVIDDTVVVYARFDGSAFGYSNHTRRGFFVQATGIAQFTDFFSSLGQHRNIAIHNRGFSGNQAWSRYRRTDIPQSGNLLNGIEARYTLHSTGGIDRRDTWQVLP